MNITLSVVKEVLAGDVSELNGAFIWVASPEGDEFWRKQYEARELSPEGRAILEKMLTEKKNET